MKKCDKCGCDYSHKGHRVSNKGKWSFVCDDCYNANKKEKQRVFDGVVYATRDAVDFFPVSEHRDLGLLQQEGWEVYRSPTVLDAVIDDTADHIVDILRSA